METPAKASKVAWIWWTLFAVALLLMTGAFLWGVGRFFGNSVLVEPVGGDELPSEVLDLPPSERAEAAERAESDRETGAEGDTEPEVVPGPGQEGVAYEELRCAFTGQSKLDPGLSGSMFAQGSRQRMTLAPGARFECDQNGDATAGTVEMDATFADLNMLSGVAKGTGRILWEQVPPHEAAGHGTWPLESSTDTEVELAFPEILVWVTITDGPYEGYRGKLVLDRWELIHDDSGTIVGVNFEPTDFRFSEL
jgi:hypothetical protein